jgi:hypothetical protein
METNGTRATGDLLQILAANPGATESSIRSYLRSEFGSSAALTDAIDRGVAVRKGDKIYLAGAQ